MEVSDFLNVKPETLAKEQEIRLRTYVSDKLIKIAKLIQHGDYRKAQEFLASSPAGDDHGLDNMYIDFEELRLNVDNHGNCNDDIGSVLERLIELEDMQKDKKK